METGLRWLLLVAVLKGVQCQEQLKESGGGLVTPAGTLTHTCTASGSDISSYYISWVRQAPGKGLEYIGYISSSGSAYYASWVNGRFTISKTSTTVDLKLTSLSAADIATYFCARDTARGLRLSPDTNLPAGARGYTRGRIKRTEPRFWSCTGAEGDEALVSCQGFGVSSHLTVLRKNSTF